MAKQVVVTVVDDFDGKSKADETVQFTLDGVTYEMDLSLLNGARLRGVFQRWTSNARRVARVPRDNKKAHDTKPAYDRERAQAIREWAKANGHAVSERGRISLEVRQAYRAAVQDSSPTADDNVAAMRPGRRPT